jgi:orotidine-5'-phosphate decarboxylase
MQELAVHFADRLIGGIQRVGNPILVGIDPRMEDLPSGLLDAFPHHRDGLATAFQRFGVGVVDAVAPLVVAVKFQAAFYELLGPEGMGALYKTVRYAQERGLIVILDGKRNDIGSTADAYARAYLGRIAIGESQEPSWNADALTVNPYLGSDGILPFVNLARNGGKGVFVLVRTSNASAGEFQDLIADGRPVYRHVAEKLVTWGEGSHGESGYSCVGAVVGATYPGELAELREALPGVLFLVPGYGAQGGSGRDVAAAFDEHGLGAIVNNSRGLTFAYKRPEFARFGADWQRAIEAAVREMSDDLAANTPAGRLRSAQAGRA